MAGRVSSVWVLTAMGAMGGCTTENDKNVVKDTPPEAVELGYPSSVDRFTFRVSRSWVLSCHATLIHQRWLLTAAHCFVGIEPGASGILMRSFRRVDAENVHFHPGAFRDGTTRIDAELDADLVMAEHDLALIQVAPPISELERAALWHPSPVPDNPFQAGDDLWFGRERNGLEQTATASIVGVAPANLLLGPGQGGPLLVARGAAAIEGDSGGGAFARAPADSASLSPALQWAHRGQEALVAVMQNADPDNPRAPFGLVPVWTDDHAGWIVDTILEETDEPEELPPDPNDIPRWRTMGPPDVDAGGAELGAEPAPIGPTVPEAGAPQRAPDATLLEPTAAPRDSGRDAAVSP